MSSHSKVSGVSEGTDPKSEEQASPSGLGALRAPELGLDLGLSGNSEDQGQGQDRGQGQGQGQGQGGGEGRPSGGERRPASPQSPKWQLELDSECESESELEMSQVGAVVLRGFQARPSTPAPNEAGAVGFTAQFAESYAAIVRPLSHVGAGALRKSPGVGRSAAEAAAIWAPVEAGPSRRGSLSCEESLQACASPRHMSAPREGQAQEHSKKRGGNRNMSSSTSVQSACEEGAVGLPSDSESSDELGEIQPMRVSIHFKRGGQVKGSSMEVPGQNPRPVTAHCREKFPHMSGPLLTSAPRRLTWAVERQAVGEPGSSSKKMQSVLSGKGVGRPSHISATAAAAAATAATTSTTSTATGAGGLPLGTPRRKPLQEKRSLGVASEVVLGISFAPWGHRQSAAPVEPAILPPVSGISLLEKPSTASPLPWGSKQSKQGGAGKKPGAKSKSQTVAGRDHGPNRDPMAQLPARRPGVPSRYMHHGELSSGGPHTRDHQIPEHGQPLSLNQAGVTPRGPAFSGESGDQEPPVRPRRPAVQQLPPGIEGCPRCVVLENEAENLREKLAIMRSLAEKFQNL